MWKKKQGRKKEKKEVSMAKSKVYSILYMLETETCIEQIYICVKLNALKKMISEGAGRLDGNPVEVWIVFRR